MNTELIQSLKDDLKTKKQINFWRVSDKWGFLSNWYKQDLVIKDKTFKCVEQYMMWSKAVMMGDFEIAGKILSISGPKKMKALGREVKNFNQVLWDENKYEIVREAIISKVKTEELKEVLLSEEAVAFIKNGGTFVEASPLDKIWGIGMTDDNPDVYDQSKWKGQNLLGMAINDAITMVGENKELITGWEELSQVYIKGTRTLNEKYSKFIAELDVNFYKSLYEELIKIFKEDGREYPEEIPGYFFDFNSSTCGWHDALKKVLGTEEYEKYYDLDWYDSDFLDGEIEERLSEWYVKNILKVNKSNK